MPRLDELRGQVREAVSGEPLPARLLTANAYLGALPIAAALAAGADIVVTGRCADSALALGILMHEFGWKPDDYDRLAAGSLVGHVLECGPQSTGGTFTDWEEVPNWHNIGYPIAECAADGGFVLSKPEGTGGLVVPGAVAEQVLYEVGDPSAYILPDVVADFSHVTVKQVGAKSRQTGRRQRAAANPAVQSVSDLSGRIPRCRLDLHRGSGCRAQGRANRTSAAGAGTHAVSCAEPGRLFSYAC